MPHGGRTVNEAEYSGSENGENRAPMSAERMQPSAGVPAAGPVTLTFFTRPSDPNVTVALDPVS